MEKALEILKQVKGLSGWIKCGAELPLDEELDEAIAELEEAMKPKTCLSCVNCNKDYQLMSNPPQYELKCGVFKTVFVNDFKQYCSRYEPKDKECGL